MTSDAAIADLIGSVDGDMGGIAVDAPTAGVGAEGAGAAAADGVEGGDVYDVAWKKMHAIIANASAEQAADNIQVTSILTVRMLCF